MKGNPVTISSKDAHQLNEYNNNKLVLCIGLKKIIDCCWGRIIAIKSTQVSPIDISEQLLIYENICTKIHTKGADLKMI